jgi:hypothetical protein
MLRISKNTMLTKGNRVQMDGNNCFHVYSKLSIRSISGGNNILIHLLMCATSIKDFKDDYFLQSH